MKLGVTIRGVFGVFLSFLTLSVHGQSLSPEMIGRLNSMSPAEQQSLARQYGVSVPSVAARSSNASDLATPGETLPVPSGMTQAEIEAATPDKTEEVEERARTRYGRTLFSRDVSTFAPTDDAPVPDSYRLGVGDQIVVQLFGKENNELNLQIGRSGDVSFPRLGSISLSGLTFEDARDLIKTRVEQQLIGVEAIISMGRLRAINVFMAGEVAVPGAYSVSALTTVSQSLFQAGGVTDIGSLRHIQVKRAGLVVASFDTYDLLMRGDTSGDIRLQSGDVVFVPPYTGVIDLEGELKRPMVYELAGGETIGDVLSMAGSFTRDAYPALSILTRKSDALGLPTVSTVDLTNKSTLALVAEDGDTLVVPKVGSLVMNSVSLKGAVNRPGSYGWTRGMRVSDLVGNAQRDLALHADINQGMIIRQKNELLDIEVIAFDLGSAIGSPHTETDPMLQEFDEVLIFPLVTSESAGSSRQQLLGPVITKLSSQARQGEPVQTVSISGAVRAPGVYPLLSEATVKTLINAAGGLTDSAFLQQAELRRLDLRSDGEVYGEYQDINVQSGHPDTQITLTSRDHITIREIPGWSPSDSIVVKGEVKFPGEYLIRKGETLSDVVARAGGLTDNASPNSAVFTRESVAIRESERSKEFARQIQSTFATRLLTEETTTRGVDEVSAIVSSLQSFQGVGRLLIDLPAAMEGNLEADLEVQDGDELTIPVLSNTVSVLGEVMRQGTHSYQSELALDDYIDLSAGFTQRADEGGSYIIKANGTVVNLERNLWRFTTASRSLDPGDTIVVPINTQYKESLASYREITQIVYQSMISIAAIVSL